jgi:dUTPase
MTLNVEQVAELGIVRNSDDQTMRPQAASLSSCHLTVGRIIVPGGREITRQEFRLKPQQMVVVVSSEMLKLPEHVFGYIMARYTLNDQGVLALSTGTVDPCYEGPVSSTLINFSNEDYVLKKGDEFLRVTFAQISRFRQREESQVWRKDILSRQDQNNWPNYSNYVEDRKEKAENFPNTFLNIPLTAEKIAKQEAEARFKRLDSTITRAGVILAGVTILFGIISFYLAPKMQEQTNQAISNSAAIQVTKDQILPIQNYASNLDQRISDLEKAKAGGTGQTKTESE